MFIGIMEEIGKVQSIYKGRDSAVVPIDTKMTLGGIRLGDSIAADGARLTATPPS